MAEIILSDTQLVILSAAAQRDDLQIFVPDHLRGGVVGKVLGALLGKGLIEPIPAEHKKQNPFGTQVAGATDYRISRAGLLAIGIEPEETGDEALSVVRAEDARADNGALKASDDAAANAPEKASVLGLSSAESGLSPSASMMISVAPRGGSKLAGVMALLARPEGASMDELVAKTGWLPHTTRAALTGLRKRNIGVTRAKNSDGVSIYRVADIEATAQDTSSEAA